MPQISTKLQRSHHAQRVRQIEVGYIKIGNFRPISRYSSGKHAIDRDIVTIKG